MDKRTAWDIWLDATQAVDDARGLALLVGFDCAASIVDEHDRQVAHNALTRGIHCLLKKAAALLETMEPHSEPGGV